MKKRIMSVCFALLLMTNMLLISTTNVEASSDDLILDGSYLTHDEESIGYDTKITRGEDLLTGYSKCVRLGPGKLYAGGTTIAAHTVENVQVWVVVERAQEGDTAWSLSSGTVFICHRDRWMVWNGTVSGNAGSDSCSR